MKNKVLERKDFLNLLSKNKGIKKRDFIINKASKKDIDAVSEICQNLLHGNIKVNNRSLKNLYKCRHDIRQIADKKLHHSDKRKIISQRGGFLSVLIPAAIEAVSALIKIIKSKKKYKKK